MTYAMIRCLDLWANQSFGCIDFWTNQDFRCPDFWKNRNFRCLDLWGDQDSGFTEMKHAITEMKNKCEIRNDLNDHMIAEIKQQIQVPRSLEEQDFECLDFWTNQNFGCPNLQICQDFGFTEMKCTMIEKKHTINEQRCVIT